ncbi:MAG TPA: gamma-glutamyl-gamma-aminobutyrate hydrolase family protein, partial [Thiolinea sp.]|nr:gamma-glutamyl-gamma-aminobutyrate hydrolase family protein [Thiolinea sp.]
MLIGILETGRPPEELQTAYGSYVDMFKRLLGGADDSFEFKVYAVLDNELPTDPAECDAWLVTGSRHGVYENLPWMLKLQDFIRAVWQAEVPMIGICFGHQVIATALGGKVEKSAKGWGVGLQEYTVKQPQDWMDERQSITFNAMHQDQVVELPTEAEVFASSEFCEFAGLVYGGRILTFQGHPEFTTEFEESLLKLRRGAVVPNPVADPALASLESGEIQPEAQSGEWMAKF